MNFQKHINKCALPLLLLVLAFSAIAQDSEPTTIMYKELAQRDMGVVAGTNLYCAGYFQSSSVDTSLEIVGAEAEKDKHIFALGDFLYIGSGRNSGVKVGDMYSIIRPRGKFKSKFSKKKLGNYVEEVGAVEVVKVRNEHSLAVVRSSCSTILLGDLLKKAVKRQSPMFKQRPSLNVFADSSQKASGRIVMAKGGRELIGREQIVFVDLGREDNVKVGDYMTIYRPLGTGNIRRNALKESSNTRDDGFESSRYGGGPYSNKATRKRSNGSVVTSEDAKKRRPKSLRRVVGELVVLNVSEKVATAVIVRTASEIHTGDRVEIQ